MHIPKRPVATAIAVLAVVILPSLVGCSSISLPDFMVPKPAASARAVAAVAPLNDLSLGSAHHTVAVGNVSLAIAYWSTLRMDKWTASANKPVNISVVATLAPDTGQLVYLSRVAVVTTVNGPQGPLASAPDFVDAALVSPGYLMKSPYSYSSVFSVPRVDPKATSVTLSLTYDVVQQVPRTASAYTKSTATDQITIALNK